MPARRESPILFTIRLTRAQLFPEPQRVRRRPFVLSSLAGDEAGLQICRYSLFEIQGRKDFRGIIVSRVVGEFGLKVRPLLFGELIRQLFFARFLDDFPSGRKLYMGSQMSFNAAVSPHSNFSRIAYSYAGKANEKQRCNKLTTTLVFIFMVHPESFGIGRGSW